MARPFAAYPAAGAASGDGMPGRGGEAAAVILRDLRRIE